MLCHLLLLKERMKPLLILSLLVTTSTRWSEAGFGRRRRKEITFLWWWCLSLLSLFSWCRKRRERNTWLYFSLVFHFSPSLLSCVFLIFSHVQKEGSWNNPSEFSFVSCWREYLWLSFFFSSISCCIKRSFPLSLERNEWCSFRDKCLGMMSVLRLSSLSLSLSQLYFLLYDFFVSYTFLLLLHPLAKTKCNFFTSLSFFVCFRSSSSSSSSILLPSFLFPLEVIVLSSFWLRN